MAGGAQAFRDQTSGRLQRRQAANGRRSDTRARSRPVRQRDAVVAYKTSSMYGALRRTFFHLGRQRVHGEVGSGWPGVRRCGRIGIACLAKMTLAVSDGTVPQPLNAPCRSGLAPISMKPTAANIIGAGGRRDPLITGITRARHRPTALDSVPDHNYRDETNGALVHDHQCMLYSYGALSYDALGSNYATYNDLPAVSRFAPVDGQHHCPCGIKAHSCIPHWHAGSFVDQNRRLRGHDRQHVPGSADTALSVHRSSCATRVRSDQWASQHPGGNRDLCDNYYRDTLGDTQTQDTRIGMSRRRFDFRRSAHWHAILMEHAGPMSMDGPTLTLHRPARMKVNEQPAVKDAYRALDARCCHAAQRH